jgi:hypothetical protein
MRARADACMSRASPGNATLLPFFFSFFIENVSMSMSSLFSPISKRIRFMVKTGHAAC